MYRLSASSRPPLTSTRSPSSKISSNMRSIKQTCNIILKSIPWTAPLNRSSSCSSNSNSRWWCARSNSVLMSNKAAWLAHSRWFCSNSTIIVGQILLRRLVEKIIQGLGPCQVWVEIMETSLRKTNKEAKWCTLKIFLEVEIYYQGQQVLSSSRKVVEVINQATFQRKSRYPQALSYLIMELLQA